MFLECPTTEYLFILRGQIIPKSRPRLTHKGRAYLPQNYRDWKDTAIASLRQQAGDRGIVAPLDECTVSLRLTGRHSRRSDLDNTLGSVLDAMQQAGVIKNDNMRSVLGIEASLEWSGDPPMALIVVSG